MNLEQFAAQLDTFPEVQEGAFKVRKTKEGSETMHWYYESQETAGKITEITDETRHGSKVTKFKLQTPEGEAAIEYPKEFSLTEGNNLLNQDVEYRRIEERYEESFRFGGGTSLTTNYQMRILSGTFKGMSLKARTTS